MSRSTFVVIGTSLALLSSSGASAAAPGQGSGDPKAAHAVELFNEGKTAADQGDYTSACPKFAESARLDARVGTLARLGECEEKLGHLVAARTHWGQARDLARKTHDARADHAQREYTRIDALTPKLRLTFDGQPPPDFSATIDADRVDASGLGTPIPVEPGAHAVRATATGKAPFSSSVVTAADGATTNVPIVLAEPTVAVAPTPDGRPAQPTPPPAPAEPGWNGGKTAAVVVGAVGVVGLGLGGAFGGLTFSEWASAKHDCGGGCASTSPAANEKSKATTYAAVSDVGFAAGGAAIVGAGILWFTAGKRPASASAVHVVPSVGPNSVGLEVLGPLRWF